jgi:hypothetical protein
MNKHRSSCKVPVISVLFYRHFNFQNIFSKNIQIILMKICQVGVELFHIDQRKNEGTEQS